MLKVKDLKEIYKETKALDLLFDKDNDIRSKEIIRKNILALLVEIGELANETRCFKFWSVKPSSSKEIVLEEYIDTLFMILCFCNITEVDLTEDFPSSFDLDIIDTFTLLYNESSSLKVELDKEKIKKLLVIVLHLGDLLNFTIEDLEEGTRIKSEIIRKRFETNY